MQPTPPTHCPSQHSSIHHKANEKQSRWSYKQISVQLLLRVIAARFKIDLSAEADVMNSRFDLLMGVDGPQLTGIDE